MKSSVLTLRKPIPLSRAIRWVPAGLFTPPRTLDDLALFITQSALRDVMRHLRSDPEKELLGFLLGELYECPETGARYVVVNSAVRTGHAIAESDRILIPEEEWLGVQLEVRRRRTQLMGWYHSAPFVGPHPARADLETHRALFTEPWQCGLVIATTGDAPTGAFFRSLMGERTGGGVLVPFYELADEDEPLPADGRKRTLIDWVNYETRGIVERDESERRPFVASPPPTPRSTPVILSVPNAPEDDAEDEEDEQGGDFSLPAPPGAPSSATPPVPPPEPPPAPPAQPRRPSPTRSSPPVIPLNPPGGREPVGTSAPAARSNGGERAGLGAEEMRAGAGMEAAGGGRRTPPGSSPPTPPFGRAGGGLVMLPSAAELQEMLAEPPLPIDRGGVRSGVRVFLVLLTVAAVALVYLWNSGRLQLPGFLAGIPVLDNSGVGRSPTPSPSSTPTTPANDAAGAARPGNTDPAALAPPVAESAGASLSLSESTGVDSAPTDSAAGRTNPPTTRAAAQPATPTDPAVLRFGTLADTLEESIRNFEDRHDDFTVHRITCAGLAIGYRTADDAFIALASAHRAARDALDPAHESRYRELVDQMGKVNEEFGESGCPRP